MQNQNLYPKIVLGFFVHSLPLTLFLIPYSIYDLTFKLETCSLIVQLAPAFHL